MKTAGPVLLSIMITSALWLLAVGDGTVDCVKNYYTRHQQTTLQIAEETRLQREVNILKLQAQRKIWAAWLKKAEQLEDAGNF